MSGRARRARARMMVAALIYAATLAARADEAAYLKALRTRLRLSLDAEFGGNHTAVPGRLHAMAAFKPRSLLFTLQPRYVYTVSDALGQVTHINKCSKHLPKTLPRHFVLSAFLLHQRYVAQENNIINLWLAALPPLDATCLWTDEQLEELDEPRIIRRSKARRAHLANDYKTLLLPLLDECGMREDVDTRWRKSKIDWAKEYAWAATVVEAYKWQFAEDFPVIVPIALRFHWRGNADIVEWGSEGDPGAAVYASEDSGGWRSGEEIRGWSESAMVPEDLILHSGRVWEDKGASRTMIALKAGGGDGEGLPSFAYGAEVEERRDELLSGGNWSRSMQFEVSDDGMKERDLLNEEMMGWLRLVFASEAEVKHATSHDDFIERKGIGSSALASLLPMSERKETESRAVSSLLKTLDTQLSKFEYSVEEDEAIIEAFQRPREPTTGREYLAVNRRKHLAVTYRRLQKLLLMRTKEAARKYWIDWQRKAGVVESVAVDAMGGAEAPPKRKKKKKRARRLEEIV